MIIIGVDPGTTESAYCSIDENYNICIAEKVDNCLLTSNLHKYVFGNTLNNFVFVIESLQCYGQAVGREVFETAYMVGRIMERLDVIGFKYHLYPKPEYARAICGVNKTSDTIIWQSLKLRFGGSKKGEPLNKLVGHTDLRSAFAIAAYHVDLMKMKRGGIIG